MRPVTHTLLFLGVLAGPVSAAQAGLTSRDSAEIWVGVVRALLDSLSEGHSAVSVLWVAPPRALEATGQIRVIGFSATVRSVIEAALPAARAVDTLDSAFLCEPGVRLAMPTRGCAIRDGGLAVLLGHFGMAGDTIRTFGTLMRSSESRFGPLASSSSLTEVLFVRRPLDGWQLVAARGRIVS